MDGKNKAIADSLSAPSGRKGKLETVAKVRQCPGQLPVPEQWDGTSQRLKEHPVLEQGAPFLLGHPPPPTPQKAKGRLAATVFFLAERAREGPFLEKWEKRRQAGGGKKLQGLWRMGPGLTGGAVVGNVFQCINIRLGLESCCQPGLAVPPSLSDSVGSSRSRWHLFSRSLTSCPGLLDIC